MTRPMLRIIEAERDRVMRSRRVIHADSELAGRELWRKPPCGGKAAGTMVEELIGQSLGQYQILELIGQGGMARVYKAYQPALERFVAIKGLPTPLPTPVQTNQDSELLKRFYREARLVAKLNHPHIVPIYDFGEDHGWAFIVMEHIAGGTVRDQLAKADALRVRLSLPWVLKVVEQAALALDFAQLHGVVHRDVKPGNMLLRGEDFMLLSDFGIATILNPASRSRAPARRSGRRSIWRRSKARRAGSPMGAPTSMRWASCSTSV